MSHETLSFDPLDKVYAAPVEPMDFGTVRSGALELVRVAGDEAVVPLGFKGLAAVLRAARERTRLVFRVGPVEGPVLCYVVFGYPRAPWRKLELVDVLWCAEHRAGRERMDFGSWCCVVASITFRVEQRCGEVRGAPARPMLRVV